MQLKPNEIHVWSTDLAISPEEAQIALSSLSPDEVARAQRFRLDTHRYQFIAARSTLRHILSLYLGIPAYKIAFAYTEHNKPHLLFPPHSPLQFNLAHSDDVAVYAITLEHAIGIDIEKIQEGYNPAIANRFFSEDENQALNQLPTRNRAAAFYRVWSRKEAMIKAVGKGLSLPLASFSVSVQDIAETLTLENDKWTLLPLTIPLNETTFQSALASNQIIQSISYWNIFNHKTKLINEIRF